MYFFEYCSKFWVYSNLFEQIYSKNLGSLQKKSHNIKSRFVTDIDKTFRPYNPFYSNNDGINNDDNTDNNGNNSVSCY